MPVINESDELTDGHTDTRYPGTSPVVKPSDVPAAARRGVGTSDPPCLFDLDADPNEHVNLALTEPLLLARMQARCVHVCCIVCVLHAIAVHVHVRRWPAYPHAYLAIALSECAEIRLLESCCVLERSGTMLVGMMLDHVDSHRQMILITTTLVSC